MHMTALYKISWLKLLFLMLDLIKYNGNYKRT